MTDAPYRVRTLSSEDWRLLQDARLQSLRDSPQAFISDHDDVAQWVEKDWIRAFDDAIWLAALCKGEVVGILGSVPDTDEPTSRHLQSAWVAPAHRRNGVFRALLDLLITLVKAETKHFLLWVFEKNVDALQVYRQVGFEDTDKRQQPEGSDRYERQLRFTIT